MTFQLDQMRSLAEHGSVIRVVVAGTKGSVPREVGASLLISGDDVVGTVGGGALEFDAIKQARACVQDRIEHVPLGPALGQCCGGLVTLLTEVWDTDRLNSVHGNVVARPLPNYTTEAPIGVRKVLSDERGQGNVPTAGMIGGWMVEPVSRPSRQIWIWGAGHVGRALVGALEPMPDVQIMWADSARDRFPADTGGIEPLIADNPADLVSLAADHAEHFVLTYSHALDLELCHRILSRPFRALGLIGSQTKWARFQSRLKALGHTLAHIQSIQCPIGDTDLGKHPQAIAIGVAAEVVRRGQWEAGLNSKIA